MEESQAWARCPARPLRGCPGLPVITTPCFQLDPQTLHDRDWQRTVIAMNGVRAPRRCAGFRFLQRVGVVPVPSETLGAGGGRETTVCGPKSTQARVLWLECGSPARHWASLKSGFRGITGMEGAWTLGFALRD